MATVNFSVPDDVKHEFDRTCAGENKSALIAGLMREAVEDRRTHRRVRAMEGLLGLRRRTRPATTVQVRAARAKGRP